MSLQKTKKTRSLMGILFGESLILWISQRFVFGLKDDKSSGVAPGFISFIASISIFGLSLGVMALLVVTSVMNGFEKELKKTLTSFHGHILLFSRGAPVEKPEAYITDIEKNQKRVVAVSPYLFSEVMLSQNGMVSGSIVEGIEKESFSKVSDISKRFLSGSFPRVDEIALGVELARKLHVKTGDKVFLTIPFFEGGNQPLVKALTVSGIVKIGMYEYDNKYSFMDLSDLQKTLHLEKKVNGFKILTKDADFSENITNQLNERYVHPMRARDWSSLNRNLFYAIRLEKVVIAIILAMIILVASFNIVSTVLMIVHEKKRQVSMLKALGFKNSSTLILFLIIGFGMAFCGMLLGLGLGRFLCGIVQWVNIIDLPADIYMFSRLPVEMRLWEWVFICVGAVVLALSAALWPSINVSRQVPARGIHYE